MTCRNFVISRVNRYESALLVVLLTLDSDRDWFVQSRVVTRGAREARYDIGDGKNHLFEGTYRQCLDWIASQQP